ncbi:hypothetical protein VULLAG_LOCUS16466 [Vulpes lagopus]
MTKRLEQREEGSQGLSCPSGEPGFWWHQDGFENEKLDEGQPRWLSGLASPSAQGMILKTWDGVPCRAPCMEPASPSACVSASLSLSLSLSLSVCVCVSHE